MLLEKQIISLIALVIPVGMQRLTLFQSLCSFSPPTVCRLSNVRYYFVQHRADDKDTQMKEEAVITLLGGLRDSGTIYLHSQWRHHYLFFHRNNMFTMVHYCITVVKSRHFKRGAFEHNTWKNQQTTHFLAANESLFSWHVVWADDSSETVVCCWLRLQIDCRLVVFVIMFEQCSSSSFTGLRIDVMNEKLMFIFNVVKYCNATWHAHMECQSIA